MLSQKGWSSDPGPYTYMGYKPNMLMAGMLDTFN